MTNKACFRSRREEAGAQIVVRAFGRQDECRVRVVEFACDGEHLRFTQSIGVEHDSRRIPREALARERIDLMNLDLARHLFGSVAPCLRGNSIPYPSARGARRKLFNGTKHCQCHTAHFFFDSANIPVHEPWGGLRESKSAVGDFLQSKKA